jgi:sugar lactone lactonase YvrE
MSREERLMVGDPVCLAATGDACGEGIHWDTRPRSVYWTDINRFLVHRYKTGTQELKTWFFSEPVVCVLAAEAEDTLVLVSGSGASLWEPEKNLKHPPFFSLPDWPRARCNDAGVDARGSIWLGSMRNNVDADGAPLEAGGTDGVLYRIDGNGDVTEWALDIGISNTLVWNPDGAKFYFADTLKNEIFSYDYDRERGSIRNEMSFFKGFDRGSPDGSAMDAAGYMWNCRYGGSCLVRVSPAGEVDAVIEMPVSNPTNCAFGGENGTTLYVTSASAEKGRWERLGGCLFAIETNIAGLPVHPFAGEIPNHFRVAG